MSALAGIVFFSVAVGFGVGLRLGLFEAGGDDGAVEGDGGAEAGGGSVGLTAGGGCAAAVATCLAGVAQAAGPNTSNSPVTMTRNDLARTGTASREIGRQHRSPMRPSPTGPDKLASACDMGVSGEASAPEGCAR
jgi:hypothetical protein